MESNKSFAVLIVAYKRVDGLKRLLSSLERVDYDGRKDIDLIISIDRSDCDDVAAFAREYSWAYGKKTVAQQEEHLGLKRHILKCGDYTSQYDILVVLEDDIYVSNSMYHYASSAVGAYGDDPNIAGISLYSYQSNWQDWNYRFEPQRSQYDAYFLKVAQSWGQVWTKDKWSCFKQWLMENPDFPNDGIVPENLMHWGESSWLKFHERYCIINDKYFVYPYTSLSTNFSDAGEHSRGSNTDYQVDLYQDCFSFRFPSFDDDAIVYDEYMNREGLGKDLGISDSDLTVDFWCTKNEKSYKRYVLTTKALPYKIVDSFSLALRPIELSVVTGLRGSGIWLYDTSENGQMPDQGDGRSLMLYSMRNRDVKRLLPTVICLASNKIIQVLKQKVFRR